MRRIIVLASTLTLLIAAAAPVLAADKTFVDDEHTVLCAPDGPELTVHVEGWFQVNNTGEADGPRVTTFHQDLTYKNEVTGAMLTARSTGVAHISDEILVAGYTEYTEYTEEGFALLIQGHRNLTLETTAGHTIDVCAELG